MATARRLRRADGYRRLILDFALFCAAAGTSACGITPPTAPPGIDPRDCKIKHVVTRNDSTFTTTAYYPDTSAVCRLGLGTP